MAKLSSRHTSDIYNEFKDLTGAEPRELARFFERNQTQIQNLDTTEYFDLQVLYLIAIFELGSYRKLLSNVDEAIEISIMHNIKEHNGTDVFHKLLFMKGESYFQIMDFDKARYVFFELLKMDKRNDDYKQALEKTYRKIIPASVKNTKALSILFFILAAIVIAFEVLVVKHFFADYTQHAMITRNVLFVLGWLSMIGAELYHYFRVQYDVRNIIKRKM